MANTTYPHPPTFVPLKEVLDVNKQPTAIQELLNTKFGKAIAEDIGLVQHKVSRTGRNFSLTGKAAIMTELSVQTGPVKLQLFPPEKGGDFTEINFELEVEETDSGSPSFTLAVLNSSLGFTITGGFFTKAEKRSSDGRYIALSGAAGKDISAEVKLSRFSIDETGALSFGGGATAGLSHPVAIGDTGFFLDGIEIGLTEENGKLALTIPKAKLILPQDIKGLPDLELTNAKIGADGFSGMVSALWSQGEEIELAGFKAALTRVSVKLEKNALKEAVIQGYIGLPFFDTPGAPTNPIAIEIGIGEKGRVTVGLQPRKVKANPNQKPPQAPTLARLDLSYFRLEVIKMRLDTGAQEGEGEMTLSGRIVLDAAGKSPLALEVKNLKILPDGTVKVSGGWYDVKDKLSYNHAGFKIGISRVGFGFGEGEKGQSFIGFDGGVQLAGSLPASASVTGFKYWWDQSGQSGFSVRGLAIDFKVPGAVEFKGKLTFFEEGDSTGIPGFQLENISGLSGEVGLKIIPIDFNLTAKLLIAKQVQDDGSIVRFWFIHLGMESKYGLPLGPANFAIYGLEGLLSENMKPSRKAPEHWYRDWYRKSPVGVPHLSKWTVEKGGFAFGVGATMGTYLDNGYLFNARALFTMALPGPVVMISGKANIFASRKSLMDPNQEALFDFLLLIDGEGGDFLFNIGVKYVQKHFLDIRGLMELYFNLKDSSNWHFYLGEEPKPKRITAKFLEFFNANAYLTVDNNSFAFGFFVGYGPKTWNFGVVGAKLAAYLEGDVKVVYAPEFFHLNIGMHGELEVWLLFIRLGLLIKAGVTISTPKPYLLDILAKVKITLPWPLPSPEISIHMQWKKIEPPAFDDPFMALQLDQHEALGNTLTWATYDSDDFPGDMKPAPMDAVMTLVFERRIGLSAGVEQLSNLKAAPHHFNVGKDGITFRFGYQLEGLRIEKLENGNWVSVASQLQNQFSWALGPDSKKAKTTEPIALQIGTTDPLRMRRTQKEVALGKPAEKQIGRKLCPPVPEVKTHCWQPSATLIDSLLNGQIDETHFILKVSGQVSRGGVEFCQGPGLTNWPDTQEWPTLPLTEANPPALTVSEPTLISESEPDGEITFAETETFDDLDELLATVDFDDAFLSPEVSLVATDKLICTDNGQLTFQFKEGITGLTFGLRYQGEVKWTLRNEQGEILQEETLQTELPTQFNYPSAGSIPTESAVLTLEISGYCFCLTSLCYQQWDDVQARRWALHQKQFWTGIEETWKRGNLILDPWSTYRVVATLAGERRVTGAIEGVEATEPYGAAGFEHTRYFQTGSPPEDLTPYVRQVVPADGGKRHFRNYYVDIHFKPDADYVPAMFDKASQKLYLYLKGEGDTEDQYEAITTTGKVRHLSYTKELFRKTTSCYNQSFEKLEKETKTKHFSFGSSKGDYELQPSVLYRANVRTGDEASSLLDFSFTTSRFRDFKDLIETNRTFWTHDLDRPSDLAGIPLTGDARQAFRLSASERTQVAQVLQPFRGKQRAGHDWKASSTRKAEAKAYQQLEKLLRFPVYLFPEHTEVHQVLDGEQLYGYALYFPEPVDWDRATLEASLIAFETQNQNGKTTKQQHAKRRNFALVRNADGTRAFLSFEAQQKQTVTRHPFEVWRTGEPRFETLGVTTLAEEVTIDPSPPAERLTFFAGLGQVFRATTSFFGFLFGSRRGSTTVTSTLPDHKLELALEINFRYTLDFVEELQITDRKEIIAWQEAHPNLPALKKKQHQIAESATLGFTFDNTRNA